MVSTASTVIAASTLAAATGPRISLGVFITLLTVLAGTILLAGVLITVSRRGQGSRSAGGAAHNDRDASVVRSWIAISLVIGLLIFVAVSFTVDEADIRSALIGALAANVGAAIAFYFSSKSSDQARQDILDATFGIETVPVLVETCVSDARTVLGTTSFKLSLDGTPGDDWVIRTQEPRAHTTARRGSTIFVTTVAPKGADRSGQGGQPPAGSPRAPEQPGG